MRRQANVFASGDGMIQGFMRTLKEQCLWLHRFESLDQARAIIGAFIERYHRECLIERLNYRTPAAARQELPRWLPN